jgi:hypothetical protein
MTLRVTSDRTASVWTASFAAILLVFTAATADAQPNCEAIPRGSERTDCYLALSQFYRAQSNLAADRALAQSDAAWYRAITGTDPPKQKARRRR